jgi:hypothetical protein
MLSRRSRTCSSASRSGFRAGSSVMALLARPATRAKQRGAPRGFDVKRELKLLVPGSGPDEKSEKLPEIAHMFNRTPPAHLCKRCCALTAFFPVNEHAAVGGARIKPGDRERRGVDGHLVCAIQASGIIPGTWIAFSKPPELFRALGLRFPNLRDYPAHLDCVFQASGIIPRTWIAFSKPPGLSRALGLRIPCLRNYSARLDCAFHASGIIPGSLFARSWAAGLSRALCLRVPSLQNSFRAFQHVEIASKIIFRPLPTQRFSPKLSRALCLRVPGRFT